MFELDNALKTFNNDKEKMKDQIKVETLQKTKELSNSKNDNSEETTTERLKCDNISIPKCHYFNNNLTCPIEEMGCMFAHKMSDMCKFDKTCTGNLCSFGHTKSIEEEPDDK